MHYHPETLLVLHNERQDRLELEAARYTLIKRLRRGRQRRWFLRRLGRLKPALVAFRPSLR